MRLLILIWLVAGVLEPIPGQPPVQADETFKPSRGRSLDQSRKQLLGVYTGADKGKTLFCGCQFDAAEKLSGDSCDQDSSNSGKKDSAIAWLYGMPPFQFGKTLECWSRPVCARPNGRPFAGPACCREKSDRYRQMEADMHNLFPALTELNRARVNQAFGEIKGERRKFGECDLEVNRKFIEPAPSARGEVARAYFYMSRQYGVPLRERFEDMLRMWHVMDPPDLWEMDRNSFIEEKQGNRNPFVDYPELAERVRDF